MTPPRGQRRTMSDRLSTECRSREGKVPLQFLAIGAVLVAALVVVVLLGRGASEDSGEEATFDAVRGPLRISVTVAGQVKARDQLVISSELEGQSAILFIQPEGTRVKKGDLLVELDASALVDNRVDQQIRVQNADAAFVSARENLEVVRNQTESDVDQAELNLQFARQDLEKYREGELPREIKAAEATITLSEEELSRAEEKFKWSQILFDEKYLSQTELQADELAANKARLDLELAKTDLQLLLDYTSKKTMAELESGVSQTEMALERTRRKANADIVQAEANLQARELEFEREKGKLEKIERQISKAKIEAPMDGMVVYATSAQVSWRGNDEPLAEGQMVRERQALIHLPTTDSYTAEVSVHESVLDKLRRGLVAVITIDALPGKVFRGRVESIAPLPDGQSMFMNPDLKVYDTQISIAGDNPSIRNGMSCQAEIIIEEYADAIYIPLQAVMRVNGEPTVYVRDGGGWGPRTIQVGLDNNRVIHVLDGLSEGETVLLTPPLAEGAQPVSSTMVIAEEDTEAGSTGEGTDSGAGEPKTGSASPSGEAANSSASGESVLPAPPQEAVQGGEGGERPTGGFEGLSPEQRESMRARFEQMSPEEREAARQRFGGSRNGGGRGEREGGGDAGPTL